MSRQQVPTAMLLNLGVTSPKLATSLTVTSTLSVNGQLGVGGGPGAGASLYFSGTPAGHVIYSAAQPNPGGNNWEVDALGIYGVPVNTASYTGLDYRSVYVAPIAVPSGYAYNYGVYIGAPTGGSTSNIGLYNGGTTQLQGSIGVAIAPVPDRMLVISGTTTTQATQVGINVQATCNSAATSIGIGVAAMVTTAAASFTMSQGMAFYVNPPTLGSGSAITNSYGLYVNNMGKAGVTNAYGIMVLAQSGASSANIGIYNQGHSVTVGSVFCDGSGANNGAGGSNVNSGTQNGIFFGGSVNQTGEYIASNRAGTTNQYGLDFFTGWARRVYITNAGNLTLASGMQLQSVDQDGVVRTLIGPTGDNGHQINSGPAGVIFANAANNVRTGLLTDGGNFSINGDFQFTDTNHYLTPVSGNHTRYAIGPGGYLHSFEIAAASHGSGGLALTQAAAFNVGSARALKDNIRQIEDPISLVTDERLHGVRFDWRDDGRPGIGFVADDWLEKVPELVHVNDGEMAEYAPMSMDYGALGAITFQALKAYIQRTEARIAELEAKLAG